MKTIQLIALCLLIVLAASKRNEVKSKVKLGEPSETKAPQWTCPKVEFVNNRAFEDGADNTKCQYIEYIKQQLILEYTTPTYPSCYSTMDEKCVDLISGFGEKKNIRIFSRSVNVWCSNGGGQWDDFVNEIAKYQSKYTEFNTDYWNCIKGEGEKEKEDGHVTFPYWPAPHLDVLNFVCQGIEAELRNAERAEFKTWFEEDNGSFKVLPGQGYTLFTDVANKLNDSSVSDAIKQCFITEIGYFMQVIFPEVEGTYEVKRQEVNQFEQGYLYVDENEELSGGIPFDEEEEGYECWNYYSPKVHYSSSTAKEDNKVANNLFSGNKGHPLCAENTIYEPLSKFGPLCCPIHPVDQRPYTYNCCIDSSFTKQMRTRRRPMRKQNSCYGCTCLQGYEMDLFGDYWDLGERAGACKKIDDGELDIEDEDDYLD